MKKLLGTLLVAPLAVTACSDAAKAPTSIDVPMPEDAKQKVIVEFHNATKNLGTTDLTAWGEACDKYFDASFKGSTASGEKSCKDYFIHNLKESESLGTKSGLKSWDWREITGDDTAGWTVPALLKTEIKITNQAKFDKYVDDNVAAAGGFFTKESLTNLLKESFKKELDFGSVYTYELVKSGDTYKIKALNKQQQSA